MTIKEINDQKIMNFLENIKLLRSHYSFSKKKMAEIMGIRVKMLSKLESGEMSKGLSIKALLIVFFSIFVYSLLSVIFPYKRLTL